MGSNYTKFTAALSIIIIFLALRFSGDILPEAITAGSQQADTYDGSVLVDQRAAQQRPAASGGILGELNDALVHLAEEATPTVVTVQTERTVQVRQRNPFDFFDDFFRGHPFFREQPQEERQPQERRQQGVGSGVIVSEDGYILTNYHVIAEADSIKIGLKNGDEVAAEVVGSDPQTDIAVLNIQARDMPYMEFGDSDHLRVGEMVLAIGSPLGTNLAHSVTQGIVSAKGRDIDILSDVQGFEDFIQTDAAINRGNSGGPLVNMQGQLVGINTAIASQSGGFQGIGFSVPSNMARHAYEQIKEHGQVVRAFMGIYFRPVNQDDQRALGLQSAEGIIVEDTEDGGPADEAGLQELDVILEYNGNRVQRDGSAFRRYIAMSEPGTEVELLVQRGGEELTLNVELGQRAAEEIAGVAPEESQQPGQDVSELLGFTVTELTSDIARRHGVSPNVNGVVVDDIAQNSPAYQRGLRTGDIIITLNRQRIESTDQFHEIAARLNPGDAALIQIIREGRRASFAFEVGQ